MHIPHYSLQNLLAPTWTVDWMGSIQAWSQTAVVWSGWNSEWWCILQVKAYTDYPTGVLQGSNCFQLWWNIRLHPRKMWTVIQKELLWVKHEAYSVSGGKAMLHQCGRGGLDHTSRETFMSFSKQASDPEKPTLRTSTHCSESVV